MENPTTYPNEILGFEVEGTFHFLLNLLLAMYVKWIPEGLSGLPNATHLVIAWFTELRLWSCFLAFLFPWISWKPWVETWSWWRGREAMESQEPEAEASHSELGWTSCGRWGHSYPACGTVFPGADWIPSVSCEYFFLFLFFSLIQFSAIAFW